MFGFGTIVAVVLDNYFLVCYNINKKRVLHLPMACGSPLICCVKETPSILVDWAVFLIFYIKKLLFFLVIVMKYKIA